jgi:hypothetical protein
LLPNLPATQDEYLHEEFIVELLLSFLHHGVELLTKSPVDVQVFQHSRLKGQEKNRWKVVSSHWAGHSTQL